MYRFKLKEIEVGDTEIRGGKKSTVTDIDPETGAISWDVADVADFTSTYKALQQAKQFLDTLEKTGKSKDDTSIDQFAEEIANLFNSFRTHVRKNYPKEYERVSRLKEDLEVDVQLQPSEEELKVTIPGDFKDNKGEFAVEDELKKQNKDFQSFKVKDIKLKEGEIEEEEGIGYLTPRAFNKNKKSKGAPSIYYYKLGYKPVPKIKPKGFEVKQLFEYNDFQQKRINVFNEIEDKINNILPMLSNAKNETAEFYNENPGSYAIVVPTDYILEILDEVELKLKQVQDK
tara:strand:+ start:110 stop:970 length:861 start_codon:yes stop_codon:yes gene_type:complete